MEEKEKIDFNKPNQPRGGMLGIRWGRFSLALFWAILLALLISNIFSPFLSTIMQSLLGGITPILIGILIAFIFYKLVNFIEATLLKNSFKHSAHKYALKRFISLSIVTFIIIGILIIIVSILVPKIVSIIVELTEESGAGALELSKRIVNEIAELIHNWFGIEVEQESIRETLLSIINSLGETVTQINDFLAISVNVFSGIFNFVIGILLAILILKDKEKIARFSKRYAYSHFKKERADSLCILTKNSGKILFDYVICKLIEFAILFGTLGLTYTIMGLEFTWEAALLIGLFNFIPYFGAFIGAGFSVALTLIFYSLNSALYMALATIIVTTVAGNTIIPFITGSKLKVSALVVISSILIGGAMFGMAGMLFAPPIAAIISLIITSNIELKENQMKYALEVQKLREENRAQNINDGSGDESKLVGKQLALGEDLTIKEDENILTSGPKQKKTKKAVKYEKQKAVSKVVKEVKEHQEQPKEAREKERQEEPPIAQKEPKTAKKAPKTTKNDALESNLAQNKVEETKEKLSKKSKKEQIVVNEAKENQPKKTSSKRASKKKEEVSETPKEEPVTEQASTASKRKSKTKAKGE